MPARTHVVKVACLILCVSLFVLQSGCGSTGGGGTSQAPASTNNALNLTLSTASGSTTVVADGQSSVAIRIRVTNGSGAAMPDVPVTFATTAGSLSQSTVTTDASGIAQVLLTASTSAGTAIVTADVQGFRSNISITFVPGAPTRVQLTASAATVNAAGTSTLTAIVTDAHSNTVPDETVTFSLSTNNSGATLSPVSGVTNRNGQVTVTYTAGTTAGGDTVRAQVTSTSVAGSTSITVVVSPDTSQITAIALAAGTASVPADGTSTVTMRATVSVASGSPAGIPVTFTTTAGSLSAATANTDAHGVALVNLIAATSPSVATVTASAGGFSATATVTFVVFPHRIDLLVSSPQLESNGSESVTLTALVRDAANNVLSGITVSFSADSGSIQVINGTTGETGTATALLGTGGDPSNRVITVTARTDSLSSTNLVQVSGTTLTISGATNVVLNATIQLSIFLRDSGGTGIERQAITVSSALGNPLSATTVTTDTTGQATVEVTARVPGTDTIAVSALGAIATTTLSVSADNFLFTTPAPATEVPLNTPQAVTVHWDRATVPQPEQPIDFFATRGDFTPAPCPAPSTSCPVGAPTIRVTTATNGNATACICADNAGPAVISAVANVTSGPSTQVEIEFIATTVASLEVQASRTTLGVNIPPSTTQQSVITAVARDAEGNLVKNKTVSFSLTDISGGHIFPAFAITDSFGQASTVYTAGAVPSAHDGVEITAATPTVPCIVPPPPEPLPSCVVTLTVAQRPLFVVLGTGNVVQTPTPTQYALPYSVLVTDADGGPVAGAVVNLSVLPTHYQKGVYDQFLDVEFNCGWEKTAVSHPVDIPVPPTVCENEDRDHNGILDPGEDLNSNDRLDPGNVATTSPSTVTTDTSGFAFFDVMYARQFTWVEVDLVARTVVAGTEGSSSARFFLLGVASDFNDCTIPPPGQISPYGVASTCAVAD